MIKNFFCKNKNILFGIGIIFYYFVVYFISIEIKIENIKLAGTMAIMCISLVIGFLVIREWLKKKVINYNRIIIGVMLIGIILRTVYINYSTIYERQHDVYARDGHLGYMEQIAETLKLPDSNSYQLYHPPLHHIIGATWLLVNDNLGIELETAKDGLQVLTAIYSSMVMFLAYCILKEIDIKDIYKLPVMCIMAVHPTFIILAGSINNDILLNMFIMFVLLYIIKWYKISSLKNTVLLAFFTALCALSKISGTMIAIPMIFIFLRKVYEDIKENKKDVKKIIVKYIGKFSVFGVIALGLGLSFVIRNYILFEQSIFYVPIPGATEWLYCGDNTYFERFGFASPEFLKIYCDPFSDCNVWAYLIKSSLFGEFKMNDGGSVLLQSALIIFNVFLIWLSLWSLIKYKRKKENNKLNIITIMFIIYYFVQLIVYLYGNVKMPYGCTMDFRYLVPSIFIGMMFIAQSLEGKYKNNLKDIYKVVGIFSVLSIIFELTYLNSFYI